PFPETLLFYQLFLFWIQKHLSHFPYKMFAIPLLANKSCESRLHSNLLLIQVSIILSPFQYTITHYKYHHSNITLEIRPQSAQRCLKINLPKSCFFPTCPSHTIDPNLHLY